MITVLTKGYGVVLKYISLDSNSDLEIMTVINNKGGIQVKNTVCGPDMDDIAIETEC